MEFEHSVPVDSCSYESMGLFDPLSARISKHEHIANEVCLQTQEDWKRHIGPIPGFTGCIGKHNFIAITLPECLPERLGALAYASEVGFLLDDVLDAASREGVNDSSDGTKNVLSNAPKARAGMQQMHAKFMLNLIAIDAVRAQILIESLESWKRQVKDKSGTQQTDFKTIAQYLPHRRVDIAQKLMDAFIIFGMALNISNDEMGLVEEIADHAYTTLAFSNDYFSWQKEYDEFCKGGEAGSVANAVGIIMTEHSVSMDDAKNVCFELIRSSCRKYYDEKKRFESESGHKVSGNLLKYLGALEMVISGNIIWSQHTERYNFKESDGTDGNDETSQALTTLTACSSCGSSTGTVPTPNSSDLEEASRNKLKAVHESLDMDLPELSDAVIKAPSDYLAALPSKGMRNAAIDALNVWYEVPSNTTEHISSVLHGLHTSSLMLDDIEDGSPLRRSKPATHCVFGTAQTINSANFQFVETLDVVRKELGSECLGVYAEELRLLHIGQSLDLHWTSQVKCPSMAEYMKMIDYKTGGLFRMLSRTLEAKSAARPCPQIHTLMTLFSRYFQIRDDYQNLVSPDYASQKGFCKDLDESKFSLPLIHSLQKSQSQAAPGGSVLLPSLLQQRRATGKTTFEAKKLILEEFEKTDSLAYTRSVLQGLFSQMQKEIEGIEAHFGKENFVLRLLIEKVRVA